MRKLNAIYLFALSVLIAACGKEKSPTTGMNYNDPKYGGFEKADFMEQEAGPGLVFIQGGTFTMGQTEQDVMGENNALPRRVTVSSFYIDQTEVSNIDYREYLYWMSRVFGDTYPEVVQEALPDTLSWRQPLAYNEPYVRYYFRHPAYDRYPVVGVSWEQASEYAKWRTDRVNEEIMIQEGYFKPNPDQRDDDNFNTEAYLAGQYEPLIKKEKKSKDPDQDTRRIKIEDGILLPDYRLPTEAEWEYAALALVGDANEENVETRRVYPWKGLSVRQDWTEGSRYQGKMRENLRRGAGDMMGVASDLNDAASVTAPVDAYWPNDYGLYGMAGNVSEWVLDVYRPQTFEDMEDFNPFRGNVFQVLEKDDAGFIAEKDSMGRLQYRDVTLEETANRKNYKEADNIGYMDPMTYESGEMQYDYGVATLINDQARVYKGGSWNDRAFYLSPGTRRFLDQKESSATIGFRCAMIRVGPESKDR